MQDEGVEFARNVSRKSALVCTHQSAMVESMRGPRCWSAADARSRIQTSRVNGRLDRKARRQYPPGVHGVFGVQRSTDSRGARARRTTSPLAARRPSRRTWLQATKSCQRRTLYTQRRRSSFRLASTSRCSCWRLKATAGPARPSRRHGCTHRSTVRLPS